MNSEATFLSVTTIRWRAGLAIFIPVIFWNAGIPVLRADGWVVEMENGPLENLQALFLFAGGMLYLLNSRRAAGGERILYAGIALLYLTFLVLEVDLRKFPLPGINRFFNGAIRDAWLGGLWVLGLLWFLRHRTAAWQTFRTWCRTPDAQCLFISGALWTASMAVDKLKPHALQPLSLFVEELVETNATWLMLVSAVLTWRRR